MTSAFVLIMAYILGLATGILSAFWIWFIDNGKGGEK